MKLTERIQKLREQSLNAENRISAERALLITEFYKSGVADAEPVPVQRAMAFQYILEHKAICINKGELIVGERGPAPKATPTYPEICVHSLQDLEILHNRKKVAFLSDEETRAAYRDIIIPYWKGKSNRDRIFKNVTSEWKDAYEAGIFTEFQEQRAPGHTVLGMKMFRTCPGIGKIGWSGIRPEAENRIVADGSGLPAGACQCSADSTGGFATLLVYSFGSSDGTESVGFF